VGGGKLAKQLAEMVVHSCAMVGNTKFK